MKLQEKECHISIQNNNYCFVSIDVEDILKPIAKETQYNSIYEDEKGKSAARNISKTVTAQQGRYTVTCLCLGEQDKQVIK